MVNDSYGNAIMLMSHISQGIKSTLHRREQRTNTETLNKLDQPNMKLGI
jgi:hypothetical protein